MWKLRYWIEKNSGNPTHIVTMISFCSTSGVLCDLEEASHFFKVWLHFLIWERKTFIFLVAEMLSDANLIGVCEGRR